MTLWQKKLFIILLAWQSLGWSEQVTNRKVKPVDKSLQESFNSVCEWLEREGDCELHTIAKIKDRMTDDCKGQYASYSPKYLKRSKCQFDSELYKLQNQKPFMPSAIKIGSRTGEIVWL